MLGLAGPAAHAVDLASASYRLISGTVSAGGEMNLTSDSGSVRAAGTTIGEPSPLGTSIGEETGIVLVAGFWPALVGASPDQDRDGIADLIDNCTQVANTPQEDADGDGYGNLCDADLDNSGLVNLIDLQMFRQRFLTSDPAADLNSDGFVNLVDLQLLKARFLRPPGPKGAGV